MKHVTKGTPPAEFEAWRSQANEDWKPTYDELQNPQKRNLHQALLDEQGSVCCYCGRSVGFEDSHIEHFKPQERYGALQLEYTICTRPACAGKSAPHRATVAMLKAMALTRLDTSHRSIRTVSSGSCTRCAEQLFQQIRLMPAPNT